MVKQKKMLQQQLRILTTTKEESRLLGKKFIKQSWKLSFPVLDSSFSNRECFEITCSYWVEREVTATL